MMSVRLELTHGRVLMRKYACNGMSICTPFGTYTNEPPDHAAVLRATELVVFRRHDGAGSTS